MTVLLPHLLLILLLIPSLLFELTFQFIFLVFQSLLEYKILEVLDLRVQNFLIRVPVLIRLLVLMLHAFLALLILVIISLITGHLVVRHLEIGHWGLLLWRWWRALPFTLLNLRAKSWQMVVFFRFFLSLWGLLKLFWSLFKLIIILKGLYAVWDIVVLLELSLAAEDSNLLVGLLKHLGHHSKLLLQFLDVGSGYRHIVLIALIGASLTVLSVCLLVRVRFYLLWLWRSAWSLINIFYISWLVMHWLCWNYVFYFVELLPVVNLNHIVILKMMLPFFRLIVSLRQDLLDLGLVLLFGIK